MSERKYLTVTALNRYLKYRFDNDENLQDILLKAEISNFKKHSRGHLYLTLKDDQSQVSAIMFAGSTRSLLFEPKDGDKVIVQGHVSIYEPYGTYQVYIDKMSPDGIGDLYLAYEKLKEELGRLGLFNAEHKRPIPKYPNTVGVITSPTGAAIRDIINVIRLRYPLTKIIVYPALVQGVNAKESIAGQIRSANQDQLADVLIVGRGGGSIEDLWAFNEEVVARAIYDSTIPIISAVGHETDTTIADFVADLRASTPSHAAENAVPNYKDILTLLHTDEERLRTSLKQTLEASKKRFQTALSQTIVKQPAKLTENLRLRLMFLEDKLNAYKPSQRIHHLLENVQGYVHRLDQTMDTRLKEKERNYLGLSEKLELVNPLGIMKKGFTLVKQNDTIKKSVKDVDPSSPMDVQFHDGYLEAKIIRKVVK